MGTKTDWREISVVRLAGYVTFVWRVLRRFKSATACRRNPLGSEFADSKYGKRHSGTRLLPAYDRWTGVEP